MKLLKCLFLLSFFLLLNLDALAKNKYVFGAHPFKSPLVLGKMFKPIREYLAKKIGADLSFRTTKDYNTMIEAVANGTIDIAYLGPAPYANLENKYPGKVRIAAVILNKGKATFKGVLIARKDSNINKISDFKGKKFAFGDRNSTMSYYMPAYMLIKAGIFNKIKHEFVRSQDNVALGVLHKAFDGGGLKPSILSKYISRGLKVIAESEALYGHLIVVGPDVDKATFKSIQKALLNLKDPAILNPIKKSLTGFIKVKRNKYNNLMEIIKVVDKKIGFKDKEKKPRRGRPD